MEVLAEIGRLEAREVWKHDGAVSMADWLVGRYTLSVGTARQWLKTARALQTLPHLRKAYAGGKLSWDQLQAVIGFVTPDNDAEWAERAPLMSVAELRAVNKTVKSADVVEEHHRRRVEWRFDDDRPRFRMTVQMADIEGATLATWLTRRANQYDPDPQTGLYEDFESRCADALYEFASQAIAEDRDHDRATILIHTDLATLMDATGTATIADGPALAHDTLRRLACDARLQLAITNPGDGVIGVGRTTRTIPPWLKRLVQARDQHCRFPGCRRTRWTQIHHIVHWADGGPTNLDNLITLCGRMSFLRRRLQPSKVGGKINELPSPVDPRTRMDHLGEPQSPSHLAPPHRTPLPTQTTRLAAKTLEAHPRPRSSSPTTTATTGGSTAPQLTKARPTR